MQGAGCRVQGAGCRVQGAGYLLELIELLDVEEEAPLLRGQEVLRSQARNLGEWVSG